MLRLAFVGLGALLAARGAAQEGSAGGDAGPRLDHVGPGLTPAECKLANKVLYRVGVKVDTADETERIAAISPRILEAEAGSLACIQEALEEVMEQAYELTELTEEEAAQGNRGNTLRLQPKEDKEGLPIELELLALSGLAPLLLHQGNHRLAAEVTIRDIMGRHKAITDRGSVDSDGKLYPNTVAQLTAIWYNVQAFLSFPQDYIATFSIYRGALTGCDKICRQLPSFAPAWICQAEWALYAAENNLCPGHPSGYDCRSLSIMHRQTAFEKNETLEEDWTVWNEMGRAAGHDLCEQEDYCGEEHQREYFEAGLRAATAAGAEEGVEALTHQLELVGDGDGDGGGEDDKDEL
jgi:hypothetical protein